MNHKYDNSYNISAKENNINKCNCLSCDNETYFFPFNNSCLNSCPPNYKISDEKNECILEIISISEFKNKIIKNISSFMNSTNVINGTDFLAMIYSVDGINPKEQLKKGISGIELGKCTEIIKEYYNISQNESFIVLNIESKNNKTKDNDKSFDLGKNTILEIYDFSGRKLNLSICQDNIKVMK